MLQEKVLIATHWSINGHAPRADIPHGVYRSLMIRGLIRMPPHESKYHLTPEGLAAVNALLGKKKG